MRGRKPNFVACSHCRQMKLACDGLRKFPAACSRCSKAGKICSVDPSFKRTKKRDAIERELQRIQQFVKTGDSETGPISSTNETTTITSTKEPAEGDGLLPGEEIEIHDILHLTRSIQGAELPERLVRDLLIEYFTNYHTYCPILPPLSAFVQYTRDSKLLLWTVLITALRGNVECNEIFSVIANTVRNLAYDTIRPENSSFKSMQALLLLCHWPLPFERKADPSHSLIAVATHLGLRLGLHQPRSDVEFAHEPSTDLSMEPFRRKTWAICFITNLSLNAQQGLPPTALLDQSLLDLLAVQPMWFPDRLYTQLHISRVAYNICSTLGYSQSPNRRFSPDPKPVIRTFDTELRALETRFSRSWLPTEYILYLGCRMMLYTIAITLECLECNVSIGIEAPSHWIIQNYLAAISIIKTASSIREHLFYGPSRLQKLLLNAVCFLLLLKCSRHFKMVDQNVLSNGISQGWETLQLLPVEPGDFMSRACLLLERLSKYSDSLGPQDKILEFFRVRTRMGANVTMSALLLAAESSGQNQQPPGEVLVGNEQQGSDMLSMTDAELFTDINWDELFTDLAA